MREPIGGAVFELTRRYVVTWLAVTGASLCASLGGGAWLAPDASANRAVSGCKFVSKPNIDNHTDCPGVDLSQFDLTSADLWYANLPDADLHQGKAPKAFMAHANLTRAVMWGANLGQANLSFANLSSANLNHAVLFLANLSSADLRGADLTKADLRGADLSDAIFCHTKMPDGKEKNTGCVLVSTNAGGTRVSIEPRKIALGATVHPGTVAANRQVLQQLVWQNWFGQTAKATGVDHVSAPSPGHKADNPVLVVATGRRECGGRLVYTTIRVHFPKGVPYAGESHDARYVFGCPTGG